MLDLTSPNVFPLDFVRQQFPAIDGLWTFFDNAGGTQILQQVLDRLNDYLIKTNVQVGGSYRLSQEAGQRLTAARQSMATLLNAEADEVIFGSSASALFRMLAVCLGQTFQPGDEIIVTDCDHEANIGPWLELEKLGLVVKTWPLHPETFTLQLEDLEALLGPRTRLVAFTHASNVLGTINSVKVFTEMIHQCGGYVCVDGVGYAGHRAIDVRDLGVDFYVLSAYKVYGPHIAVLYGKRAVLEMLPGFNHYFLQNLPYKFEPGSALYEQSYSLLGLCDYLHEIALQTGTMSTELRPAIVKAYEMIALYEEQLAHYLLSFLNEKPNVRIIGDPDYHAQLRVPTIAFTVNGVDSATIPPRLATHQFAVRSGDFYAKRLIKSLNLTELNGVVRISLVHYNSLSEVDHCLEYLDQIL